MCKTGVNTISLVIYKAGGQKEVPGEEINDKCGFHLLDNVVQGSGGGESTSRLRIIASN